MLLPMGGAWAWTGWLAHRGFFDMGGGAAIQMSAGICAAIAAAVVGPRTGKYNHDGSTTTIPGHNVPLAAVGALLIGIGWIPYLAGCSLAHLQYAHGVMALAALNVLLGGAAGGLASIMLGQYKYRKPDIILSLMGFLGGVVCISAGGPGMPTWGAVIIGAIAGIVVPLAAVSLDLRGGLMIRRESPPFTRSAAPGAVAAAFFVPLPHDRLALSKSWCKSSGLPRSPFCRHAFGRCLYWPEIHDPHPRPRGR